MDFSKEFTIARKLEVSGIGVHSGKICHIHLFPAEAGTGINFYKDNIKIPVKIDSVIPGSLCTTISRNGISVETVEHLLASFHGLGLCNVGVRVEGNEIPILDGSAGDFATKLSPELVPQDKPREFINLNKIIYLRAKNKFIIALPASGLSIDYFLDYENSLPGFIFENFIFSPENFTENLCRARTFGFMKDAAYLREKGLALGASLENTLVISEKGYSSKLRYHNEPAKHKVLDLIGDLTFLSKNLNAKIIAYKTGHQENLQLVRKILEASS